MTKLNLVGAAMFGVCDGRKIRCLGIRILPFKAIVEPLNVNSQNHRTLL